MPQRTRRSDALSRERIVDAAVALLDAAGEGGLTFRALTEQLATGPGAIYWHVRDKGELLTAATDAVVTPALATDPTGSPRERLRAVALALFDAVDAHPWVANQLATGPWQTTAPRILESVGQQVGALGVPREQWFTVASVLVQYIVGAAAQNAANARAAAPNGGRAELLGHLARGWAELDPDAYPFTRAVADQMRAHDDREQFLAGIDLALAGVAALHPPES